MICETASQVISFAGELEEKSAQFYGELAEKHQALKDTFIALARENRKIRLTVQRSYQEVISDALEAGFCFQGLDTDDYPVELDLAPDQDFSSIVKTALAAEKTIEAFYRDAAEKSSGLLADIPRTFERIARKREERLRRIESLL